MKNNRNILHGNVMSLKPKHPNCKELFLTLKEVSRSYAHNISFNGNEFGKRLR